MRAIGYVRVSEDREGKISPEIQRAEITRYADTLGLEVFRWYEDLDLKGWQFEQRPGLQSLLKDVRAGICEAVVVYRLDRFSREPLHYYQMVYEIDVRGVQLHDASEGRYWPGPEMAVLRGLKIILAKNETANLGLRVKDAHRKLRASGRYAGGRPPYGLRRVDPGPGLEPDPNEAPWVIQIHEWFQRGWSMSRIVRELNERGTTPRQGGKWQTAHVVRVLTRPTLCGGRLDEGKLVTGGNISPVIDEETWRRTQVLMSRNRERWQRGKTPLGPIPTRFVKCGSCGRTLSLHYRGTRAAVFRCYGVGMDACSRGVVIYSRILEQELQKAIVDRLRGVKVEPPESVKTTDLSDVEREIQTSKSALQRLAVAFADDAMTREEYQGARRTLLDRLERAETRKRYETTRIEDGALREALSVLWSDLTALSEHPELLSEMPEKQRRELYELLIETATVYPRDHDPRVDVTFRS